jgi:hypothetical protein
LILPLSGIPAAGSLYWKDNKMQEKLEKLLPPIPFPSPEQKTPNGTEDCVALRPESRTAIEEVRRRTGHKDASPEDVVTMALEVFNVLTDHLSRKDSKVLLHTQGEGLRTLDIKHTADSHTEGVRTVYKSVTPKRR